MMWRLVHEDLSVNPEDSEILSRSSVIFEHDGVTMKLADTVLQENHVLGAKKVLVDTAYRLEDLARQMKSKADKLL